MKTMIKISVIVPCYQAERYIDRCMESLINQTIGAERLQVIAIDDASKDDTWKKLKVWQKRYPGSMIIRRNEVNKRQGTCRNMGMQEAEGEYIGFVDADDWIEPDMYEKLYDIAKAGVCDFVQCGSSRDKDFFYWDNPQDKMTGKQSRLVTIADESDRGRMIASNLLGTYVVTKLYRKSFLWEHSLSFPEEMIYEDVFWIGMLNCYATKIGFLEEKMYHYYRNDASVSLTRNVEQHRDICRVNRLLWNAYEERGFLKGTLRQALAYDLLCTYYLTAVKMIFLRFDKIPYDMFYEVQTDILERIPDYGQNPYLDIYTKPFNKLLLECIGKKLSTVQLEEIGEIIRKMTA